MSVRVEAVCDVVGVDVDEGNVVGSDIGASVGKGVVEVVSDVRVDVVGASSAMSEVSVGVEVIGDAVGVDVVGDGGVVSGVSG